MGQKKTKRKKMQRPYPGLKDATRKGKKLVERLEKRYLIRTLRKYKGHVGKAVEAANISKTNFYRLLAKYRLRTDSYRDYPSRSDKRS